MKDHWLVKVILGLSLLLMAALGLPGKAGPLNQSQAAGKTIYLPYILNQPPVPMTPPLWSTSWYVTTLDSQTLYDWGCAAGIRDLNAAGVQDTALVLDFGIPKYFNGHYGASLMGYGPVTVDQIALAVENFGMGYYNCTGSDTESHLTMAVGTNNYANSTNASVTYEHGAAWAKMVNSINDWLIGKGYSGQVAAIGANDIELSWNYPEPSLKWLNGYDSANRYPLYNFGALPGCPYLASPNAQCGSYPYLWTKEQVWTAIWGSAPVSPLPEIYLTNGINAQQWYLMSVYSYTQHQQAITFVGTMTQYQACQQVGGCAAIDNKPNTGWQQLYDLLNGDVRTAQNILKYSTDIKWGDEE